MFGEKEFDEAIKAYLSEKDGKASNAYSTLRKDNCFFDDVASKEDVNSQIEGFITLISDMDREDFGKRYIILCFILDFCRYLERDFLFNLKNRSDFVEMKERVGGFIDKILEANKTFSQNAKLHTIEHLLEYYGILLEALEEAPPEAAEGETWTGNNLW